MDQVEIRKLAEHDYGQVIELYAHLPPQRNRGEAHCGGGSLGQGAGCDPAGAAYLGFQ